MVEVERIVEGLPRHPTDVYGKRDMSGISVITIHHSAAPATQSLETIARYHVSHNGWPGIAYHLVVLADGRVMQTQDLETRSYHDAINTDSVGICVLGNFVADDPSEQQIAGLHDAIAWVRDRVPNDHVQTIPHRERGSSAECPGKLAEFIAAPKRVPHAGQPEYPHYLKGLLEEVEAKLKDAEGEVFALRKAVGYSNELKGGMEHWLRKVLDAFFDNDAQTCFLDIEAIVEEAAGDDPHATSPQDFIERHVIAGSRKNMATKYGKGWE